VCYSAKGSRLEARANDDDDSGESSKVERMRAAKKTARGTVHGEPQKEERSAAAVGVASGAGAEDDGAHTPTHREEIESASMRRYPK
jgi:hypothetical protein